MWILTAKLYLKNWVVFYLKNKARIGILKDWFIIPLNI